MLNLTRRSFESIILQLPDGQEIHVQVRNVHGNQVRIGIKAPADVIILREELTDRGNRSHALRSCS
jgi:carbon storage regulator CsrA